MGVSCCGCLSHSGSLAESTLGVLIGQPHEDVDSCSFECLIQQCLVCSSFQLTLLLAAADLTLGVGSDAARDWLVARKVTVAGTLYGTIPDIVGGTPMLEWANSRQLA
jgi:hypothetical protein